MQTDLSRPTLDLTLAIHSNFFHFYEAVLEADDLICLMSITKYKSFIDREKTFSNQ